MVVGGYRDAGYRYVNIDDCWSEKERDSDGNLVADRHRFPSGMRYLADEIHSLGLLFGLYGDIGTMTCARYPGFAGHFEQDARRLALDFEIDSIKVDGCNSDSSIYNITYPAFGAALNKTGRPILYNCQWPLYSKETHHGEVPDLLNHEIGRTCNQWRNYYDVFDDWSLSIRSIIDFWSRTSPNDTLVTAAGAGRWNDPDMLVVGNPGLSISEQQVQFCLWSMFAAPLMISADLRFMPRESAEILLNQEVIAINQDGLGRQGWCAEGAHANIRVYVRELMPSFGQACPKGTSDRWAVVLANFNSIFSTVAIAFVPDKHLPDGSSWSVFSVRDALAHVDLAPATDKLVVDVDESSVRAFVVTRHMNSLVA